MSKRQIEKIIKRNIVGKSLGIEVSIAADAIIDYYIELVGDDTGGMTERELDYARGYNEAKAELRRKIKEEE